MNNIYLKKEDINYINKLKNNVKNKNYPKSFVGEGQDGYLFKTKNGKLLKFFKTDLDRIKNSNSLSSMDDNDIKIMNNEDKYKIRNSTKNKVFKLNYFNYYDKNGIKINDRDSLKKINDLQKCIKYTTLPGRGVYSYETEKLIGFEEEYYSNSRNVYSSIMFPTQLFIKTRLNITKKIFIKYKELFDHNIFHMDLNLRPLDKYIGANVLLTGSSYFKDNPEIIDIDGKSAIYFEKNYYSDSDLNRRKKTIMINSLSSLSILIVELLTGEILEYENLTDNEVDELIERYISYGFDYEFIKKAVNVEVDDLSLIKDNILKFKK